MHQNLNVQLHQDLESENHMALTGKGIFVERVFSSLQSAK